MEDCELSEKVGFAIIGCGRMGSRRARTIINNKQAELICASDIIKDKAKALGKEFGCDYYQEYAGVLNHGNVDCVIICVPNKFHMPLSIKAMRARKHVWCEKPLGRNPEEASKMVEVASNNEVFLKTGSNLRYFPSVIKARELLNNDAIGEILFLRGWVGNNGEWLKDDWFSDADMAGGGTFLDNGCHLLDLTRLFLGEVKECTGKVATVFWSNVFPLEDNGFGIFSTSDGKQAFIQSSWTEWAGYMYLEVYGKGGYIIIENRNKQSKTIVGDKKGKRKIFDYSLQPSASYQLELDDFVKSIDRGNQPQASGYDGLRAVQMAYGIYESSRTGRTVKI